MVPVQLVGYGLAALAFGALALLLRPRSRDLGAPEVRLCAAAAGMAVWGACMAGPFLTQEGFLCVDALHLAVWFWLLASIARRQGQPWILIQALTWLVPVISIAQLGYGRWQMPGGGFDLAVSAIPWTGLLAAIVGLVGLEQVHRNIDGENAAPVRLMCVAIGVMFAYDLFFYAQGLLLHRLDLRVFELRGYVFAAVVPIIALAARRIEGWSFGLFVSRQVVFYSTSIVLVGVYLIVMSLGGEFVRATGGAWGPQFQLIFLLAALLLLIPLVFAGAVRRRLEVLISKHFYAASTIIAWNGCASCAPSPRPRAARASRKPPSDQPRKSSTVAPALCGVMRTARAISCTSITGRLTRACARVPPGSRRIFRW